MYSFRCLYPLFSPFIIHCLFNCCFYFCILLKGFPVRLGFSDCSIPVVVAASWCLINPNSPLLLPCLSTFLLLDNSIHSAGFGRLTFLKSQSIFGWIWREWNYEEARSLKPINTECLPALWAFHSATTNCECCGDGRDIINVLQSPLILLLAAVEIFLLDNSVPLSLSSTADNVASNCQTILAPLPKSLEKL